MKNLITIIAIAVTCTVMVSGCGREPVPYESNILNFYKDKLRVEVLIESVRVDTTLSKDDMRKIFQQLLDSKKDIYLKLYQSYYDLAKENYESHKHTFSYSNTESFYKERIESTKQQLDEANRGIYKGVNYNELIKNPPLVQQFTLRFRTQEGGSVNIQKFESEILDGDTILRAIKNP